MNICPLCHSDNKSRVSLCANCKKRMYTEPQTEWGSHIRQVARGYRSGEAKGLAHGLQKDAIQNAWGARKNEKKWGCSFELLQDSQGINYLLITDKGTHGLTGKIYEDPDGIPDDLPPDERLARFENMNFSGGNYGPGLYGRGKLIFQVVSKQGSIIYDSLVDGNEYRLGRRFQEGRRLRQFQRVLTNDDAKKMLSGLTNGTLKPLSEVGTRVIIVDPIDEVIDSIKTWEFLEHINETWWEILHHPKVKISVSYNGEVKTASCPSLIEKLVEESFPKKKIHCKETDVISIKGAPYRIKRICMAKADPSIPESLRGLYVQRKGMKVGLADLRDFPPDLEEHFLGFIQLDKEYEHFIEEAEDLEHYSFSATYSSYRELKKYAQSQFDEFKKKLGYDVTTDKSTDEKAQDTLNVAEEKLSRIMDDFGLSGLGRRPRKKEIIITVESVSFPHKNSRVEIGDEIKNLVFIVRNKTNRGKKLKIVVETRNASGVLLEEIFSQRLGISGDQKKRVGPNSIKINSKKYPNREQIFCICRAEEDSTIKAQTRIPIFIGIDAPQILEPVILKLIDVKFPKDESTRVNYNEEIRNIRYLVKNQLANDLAARFSVRTIDPENESPPIEEIISQDFILKSFSEKEIEVPTVSIDEAIYSIIGEGKVEIRTRVLSLKEQAGYKKGKKLAKHTVRFWLNKDEPGFGIFEDKQTFHGGPDAPRAKVQQGSSDNRWIFLLNVTHPHYEAVRDEMDFSNAYAFELMAREALYIALYSEMYEPFIEPIRQGDQPYEVSKIYNVTLDKILAAYY